MNNSESFASSKENENMLMVNRQVLKIQGIGTIEVKIDEMNLITHSPSC